jgi:AcrR family transcriptional regulator
LDESDVMDNDEMDEAAPARPRTKKYLARQEAIIQAAIGLLNRKGLRGMTLADVAGHFDLAPTAVAYHFRSKESLAAECYMRSLATFGELTADAAKAPTPRAALESLVTGYFALLQAIDSEQTADVSRFDDVRALNDATVSAAYVDLFRSIRRLLPPGGPAAEDRAALNAKTHFLLNQLQAVRFWIGLYAPEDYGRVRDQFLGIALDGLDTSARVWPPARMPMPEPARLTPPDMRETFLRVATSLISIEGYRGASVEKICAALKVTRGAFYHHIDAKDDLVELCLRRSLEVVARAQRQALTMPGDGRDRLIGTVMRLVDHQMAGEAPLMRTGSAQVPDAIRSVIETGYQRNCLRFAGMVSDGIADGSLKAVDSYVGARIVDATAHGASELGQWLRPPVGPRAWEHMVQPLFSGLAPRTTSTGEST